MESLNELYFPNIPKETIAKNLNIDTKIFDEIKNKKILELEEKVRPIPASNAELNLKLYRELLELNPKNTEYQSKVNYYKKRLAEQEKAEQDRKYYIDNLPEKKLPENGNIQTFTSTNKIARFIIKSSGDSHYLIKIVESLSKKTVMTIFVHKNSDITVYVPLGDYEIKFASGKKWFGYEYLFGDETSYGKFDKNFHFYQLGQQIKGYSITLYEVHDGNLSIKRIDASEF